MDGSLKDRERCWFSRRANVPFNTWIMSARPHVSAFWQFLQLNTTFLWLNLDLFLLATDELYGRQKGPKEELWLIFVTCVPGFYFQWPKRSFKVVCIRKVIHLWENKFVWKDKVNKKGRKFFLLMVISYKYKPGCLF